MSAETFTCDFPGENSVALARASSGLAPREGLAINGSKDLSEAIQFGDGGCVFQIKLEDTSGLYDYVLQVDAQGPSGQGSDAGHLTFTDAAGGTYNLAVSSGHRSIHTVRYNSDDPTIIKVEWTN